MLLMVRKQNKQTYQPINQKKVKLIHTSAHKSSKYSLFSFPFILSQNQN